MGVFKVSQVSISVRFLPGQINRLVTISAWASTLSALVDFPRLVAVPNSPKAIGDFEFVLESFADAPFGGFINDREFVMPIAEDDIWELKDRLFVVSA